MTTIYVVTSGEYSSYGIVGVFSTKEKALEWGASDNPDDDYRIEEYELDSMSSEGEQVFVFKVWIRIHDGEIIRWTSDVEFMPHPAGRRCRSRCYSLSNSSLASSYIFVCSSLSLDHAKKVAVEKRQEWLRMHPGWKPGDEPHGPGEVPCLICSAPPDAHDWQEVPE